MEKTTLILAAIFALAGCGDKDKQYYDKHIDEAEQKFTECREASRNANDGEERKSINNDPECLAAKKSFREYEKTERQKRMEQENAERYQKAKDKQDRFLTKVETELRKAAQMDYFEAANKLYELANDSRDPRGAYCSYIASSARHEYKDGEDSDLKAKIAGLGVGNIGRIWGAEKDLLIIDDELSAPADCVALAIYVHDSKPEALAHAIEGRSVADLEKDINKYCQGIDFNYSRCELSKDGSIALQKKAIKNYLANRTLLKKDFNKCQEEYARLKKQGKWRQADNAIKSYTCQLAAKAARELKVYNFKKPI